MLMPDLKMGCVNTLPGTGLMESPPNWGIRLSMGEMGLVPLPPICGTVNPRTGESEWFPGDTMEWLPGELSDPRLDKERVKMVDWSLFKSGRSKVGSGGGQVLLQVRADPSLYSSSLAKAARLFRAWC